MPDNQLAVQQIVSKSIHINTPASAVWEALTQPELMKRWMSDTPIEIITTWEIGSPFVINVPAESYKTAFTNTGVVLQFSKESVLEYSHLSSISRLPDKAESYTIIRFTLQPEGDNTFLELTLSNFPDEVHYKHFDFYWAVTLEVFKRFVEDRR